MSSIDGIVFQVAIIERKYLYNVSDIFGNRPWRGERDIQKSNKKFHNGIDISTRGVQGIKCYTPYDGVITAVNFDEYVPSGIYVTVDVGDGITLSYCHLSSVVVTKGQKVVKGQHICNTGNTGHYKDSSGKWVNSSTGPHLHLTIKKNGQAVDPAPFLYGYKLKDVKSKFNYSEAYITPDYSVRFKKLSIEDTDIKIDNLKINPIQAKNAERIVELCKILGAKREDAVRAITCSIAESKLIHAIHHAADAYGPEKWGLYGFGSWRGKPEELQDVDYSTRLFLVGKNGDLRGMMNVDKGLTVSQSIRKVLGTENKTSYDPVNQAYRDYEPVAREIVNYLWVEEVKSQIDVYATEIQNTTEVVTLESKLAPGIWQIVKVLIDSEVKDKLVNDSSIAFTQGSLYNFFQKICQQPFVEFFGDTYGDQYYFIVRKPPFTRKSFLSLKTTEISDTDVINDSLSWSSNEIYSWYQLTPNSNYIGMNTAHFGYIKAVYFPEYAEIWGSRPLSVTSNYITFLKSSEEDINKKALQDLRYIIDINSYLPFTRSGTITIHGNRTIKRGTKIYYKPTDEYYYVDSVSNDFSVSNGVIERTTTLNVSRGMVSQYVENEIKDRNSLSYFNLINYGQFDKNQNNINKLSKDYEQVNIDNIVAYFSIDKDTFSEDDELSLNMNDLKNNEVNVTKEIVDDNFANCKKIAEQAHNYKNVNFVLIGATDYHANQSYNKQLGKRRAETILSIICDYYRTLYNKSEDEIKQFKKRFEIKSEGEINSGNALTSTPQSRLFDRCVKIYTVKEYLEKENINKFEQVTDIKDGSWGVNKNVFMFFLQRKQFM